MDSLLIASLPNKVTIGNQQYFINADFRTGVRFELLMQREDISEPIKMQLALKLYFGQIPHNTEDAINLMLWFYRCGREPIEPQTDGKPKKPYKKAYDFEQDADLFISAFWQYYHIDLTAIQNLHWWKFRSLMRVLPLECELRQAMGYRTASTNGLSKSEKKRLNKMRKIYALKNEKTVDSTISLQQRDQRLKDYVAKRFAEINGGGLLTDGASAD